MRVFRRGRGIPGASRSKHNDERDTADRFRKMPTEPRQDDGLLEQPVNPAVGIGAAPETDPGQQIP